jgi:S-adenosyl methyltransferase
VVSGDDRLPLDTTRPHPARRYDALLGGKDNFAADRASAERIAAAFPTIHTAAIENRRYLQRVVSYLAEELGIAQFLDIGTGIPAAPNVHQLAQAAIPAARIVYVDNDPLVMAHARALLTSHPAGTVAYVEADLRDPKRILTHPAVQANLDFSQPVALLLIAILHFLDEHDDPYRHVAELVQALPAGSVLALSHATFDPLTADVVERLTALSAPEAGHGPFRARTHDEVARFLHGLDLLDPGLVSIVDWHPARGPKPQASAADVTVYGAVARLP